MSITLNKAKKREQIPKIKNIEISRRNIRTKVNDYSQTARAHNDSSMQMSRDSSQSSLVRQYNETLKNISFKSDNLLINMKFENIQRTVSTPNLETLQQKPLIFQKVESQMKAINTKLRYVLSEREDKILELPLNEKLKIEMVEEECLFFQVYCEDYEPPLIFEKIQSTGKVRIYISTERK